MLLFESVELLLVVLVFAIPVLILEPLRLLLLFLLFERGCLSYGSFELRFRSLQLLLDLFQAMSCFSYYSRMSSSILEIFSVCKR